MVQRKNIHEKVHSVKFNAMMNTLLTASSMLVSVVTIPYVTRTLSVVGYGNVNFAQSMSMWLSSLCLVGIPNYGIRECARVRDDPKTLARVVRELLVIITIFTVTVLICFAACIIFVPRLSALASLMWMFLISTLLLSYGVEWYFQAIEQYAYITIRSVIFKLLSLVSILLFVKHSSDWLIYGAIMALVVCGNNLFNIVMLLRNVPLVDIGPMNLRRHARPLISYAVLSISSSLYLFFDSVLLGMLNSDNTQVALYQLAAKFRGICWQVINAVIGVLIPRLSYYLKNDLKQYNVLLKRGYGFLINVCLGTVLYLLIYAQPLVALISSNKYDSAVLPVQISGMIFFFSCMNSFFGLCILCPLGREDKLAAANLLGVPVSLTLNVLLDGRVGAVGAAVAVLVAEVTIFVKQAYDSRDVLKCIFDAKNSLRIMVSHAIAFIVALGSSSAFHGAGVSASTAGGAAIIAIGGFLAYSLAWLVTAAIFRETIAQWAGSILEKMLLSV